VVKRQTVWLSTMMVLSLMLIGYYTMNNDNGIGTSSSGSSDTTSVVSPTTDNPGSTQTSDTKQTQGNGTSSTTGRTTTPPAIKSVRRNSSCANCRRCKGNCRTRVTR
jgi:stage III sporulation protein AH